MKSSQNGSIVECTATILSQFLRRFTEPLLTESSRNEMVDMFGGLVRVCFQEPQATSLWHSHLSFDGTPLEFSLALTSSEDIAFRFLIDTTFLPDDDTRAEPTMKNRSHQVVPYSAEALEMIDRLCACYLEGKRAFPPHSVALGARFCPGTGRAGRVYFRLPHGSRELLNRLLSLTATCGSKERIEGASLFLENVFGFCSDFSERGLAAIKLYSFIEKFDREEMLCMTKDFIGEAAFRLEELLDVVCSFKESWWTVPPTLVGISRDRYDGLWRVDFHFPLMVWEWHTFASLRPAISAIARRWGCPAIDARTAHADRELEWLFAPTILSIGGSEDGSEDVAVYFKPYKTLHPIDVFPSSRQGQGRPTGESFSASKSQSIPASVAFAEMYTTLLQAERTNFAATGR